MSLVLDNMRESIRNFERIFDTVIATAPFLPAVKSYQQTEKHVTDADEVLDTHGGVDEMLLDEDGDIVATIASRILEDQGFRTFTIRTKTKNGQRTEADKRVKAYINGSFTPEWTFLAYIDSKTKECTCAAMIKTNRLIDLYVNRVTRKCFFKHQYNSDGSEFDYVPFRALTGIDSFHLYEDGRWKM